MNVQEVQASGVEPLVYDVFVSYNPQDSTWVWDWLVPRLKQAQLQVAIDDESFQPGAPVLEETERCIAASRKTLVVLTPEWVGDQSKLFESLLVQHEDPGARFRQLIPLLLKPCTPPKRIELLHWVDFTDSQHQEQQFKRVVNAILGAAELPELHPERALPDAVQRTWELRWLWVVGFVAAITLVLLGWSIWSNRPPANMQPENYGIAVAEFAVVDSNGAPLRSDLGVQVARRIAGFIEYQEDLLADVMKSPVQIWGATQSIPPVVESEEAQKAQELNADVLVYGTIRQDATGWEVAPRFFLTDKVVGSASELIGEHALGVPVPLVTGNTASEGNLTATMRARVRALTQLLMGLSHYANGTTDSYRQAVFLFQSAAQDPEWGATAAASGQEVLYLFLGNALLKLSTLTDDGTQRQQLYQESDSAYHTALKYNPNYARVYNGLGSLYFQRAFLVDVDSDHCIEDWDWDLMGLAAEFYTKALKMPAETKPVSGDVDLRAHLGLGRILYYQGLCLSDQIEPLEWVQATEHHKEVVDLYISAPAEHIRFAAVLAYIDLADMALNEAAWRLFELGDDPHATVLLNEANQHYENALALLKAPLTEEQLRLAVIAEGNMLLGLCLQEAATDAEIELESFLAAHDVSTEVGEKLQVIVQDNCVRTP